MLIRLCPDSLFNLADSLLNFSGILFSLAVSRQVRVAGKFAGLLLDCALSVCDQVTPLWEISLPEAEPLSTSIQRSGC
jgi:hypothetical protein